MNYEDIELSFQVVCYSSKVEDAALKVENAVAILHNIC